MRDLYEETFKQNVLDSAKPFLVYFSAKWCGPCHAMKPIVEEISEEFADTLSVGSLNIDHAPKLASDYGVRSIPTFIIFKSGVPAAQFSGSCSKERLKALIENSL